MSTDHTEDADSRFDALEALSRIFVMVHPTMSTHRLDLHQMRFASHTHTVLVRHDENTQEFIWADGPHWGRPVGTPRNLKAAADQIGHALTTPEGQA